MLKVSLNRIIPLAEARERLSELVEETRGDQLWVLTANDKPRVVMVDVDYLQQLLRRAWFNDLAERSQSVFDAYLRRRGLDPQTMSDEEVEALLDSPTEPS